MEGRDHRGEGAAERRSTTVFVASVLTLSVLAAAGPYLPRGALGPTDVTALPAPRPMVALVAGLGSIVLYGGLGWLGLRLTRALGWPDVLDPRVSDRARFGLPLMTGLGLGVAFIAIERITVTVSGLEPLPHPPFPTSVVASLAAAIGEETLFRLFFVSFWVWLLSEKALGGRKAAPVFWTVVLVSGLAFTASHLPSVFFLYGVESPTQLPVALLVELAVLNGSLSLVAAWHLRHQGFLAAVGVHLWTDVVWHVLYGLA